MPYCCQCGSAVVAEDRFCAKCGARQTAAPGNGRNRSSDFVGGVSSRNASLLCYIPVVGWIAAIVVLASDRFRHDTQVRFHAFQGLYLFVAWLLVDWVIAPAFFLQGFHAFHGLMTGALHLLIFVAWVIMIIKVSHHEDYRLPIIGELAERSVSEQRG